MVFWISGKPQLRLGQLQPQPRLQLFQLLERWCPECLFSHRDLMLGLWELHQELLTSHAVEGEKCIVSNQF